MIKKRNIALVGFMGCGKSTIGKIISDRVSADFIDTDTVIEKNTGMSINSIFDSYGEDYFRKLERNLCKLIALYPPLIIATGGGVIKNEANVENLKHSGVIVYLKSTPERIYRNISHDNTRPLLANTQDKYAKIKELLEQRTPLYEACADYTVDISMLRIEESVQMVSRLYYEING